MSYNTPNFFQDIYQSFFEILETEIWITTYPLIFDSAPQNND
jgi:hypothetical protein